MLASVKLQEVVMALNDRQRVFSERVRVDRCCVLGSLYAQVMKRIVKSLDYWCVLGCVRVHSFVRRRSNMSEQKRAKLVEEETKLAGSVVAKMAEMSKQRKA